MSESTSLADHSTTGPADSLVGRTVAERYRVEALLGTGGMGAVYRAEHVHMRKTVALKVLHRELTSVEEVVARFEREAVAAARIEHPNVAAARDFGRLEDGSFYLVLEHVAGQSLRALIEQGPLTWERTVAIALQTTSALVAAHAAGIVHRDLKPDNVMLVAEPDGSERVKVLDFGIARVNAPDPKQEKSQLTRVGVVMGTVAYMSPEQALGQAVDERTDLYALGVMIHEMLTGHLPFEAETAAQILARQLTMTPPELPGGTPSSLSELTRELLGKTAAERPPSAAAVLERLERVGAPGPLTIARGLVAPSKRRIAIAGAGATLLGALAAFAIGGASNEGRDVERELPADEPTLTKPVASQAAPAEPAAPTGDEKSSEASPAATSAPSAKPAKAKASTPAKAAPAKKRPASTNTQKKRTGPGGIYIPPPDQWFK